MSSLMFLNEDYWESLQEADDEEGFGDVAFGKDDDSTDPDPHGEPPPDDEDNEEETDDDSENGDDENTDNEDTDSDDTPEEPQPPSEADIEASFLKQSENSQQYLDYQKKMDLIKELRTACQELSDALGSTETEKKLAYLISEQLDSLFERLEFVSLNFMKYRLKLRYDLLTQADSIIEKCSDKLNSLIEKSGKKD